MKQEVEVMRVLRVPPMGKLMVEFRGNRYATIDEVTEENVSRLLLTAVGELITFAGGYDRLVQEGLAPALVTEQSSEDESLSEQQARFLASLQAARDANKLEKKRSSAALPGIQRVSPTPASGLSPVEQIDAVLQKYVSADPDLADRNIHLEQHPEGGLQIRVDGRFYQRPREIEDQRIQVLIKKAIKEWEAG